VKKVFGESESEQTGPTDRTVHPKDSISSSRKVSFECWGEWGRETRETYFHSLSRTQREIP
jgi:hypothetical protein